MNLLQASQAASVLHGVALLQEKARHRRLTSIEERLLEAMLDALREVGSK